MLPYSGMWYTFAEAYAWTKIHCLLGNSGPVTTKLRDVFPDICLGCLMGHTFTGRVSKSKQDTQTSPIENCKLHNFHFQNVIYSLLLFFFFFFRFSSVSKVMD
jgi:hypothetical protein